jgi:NADPH-dependent 2,4-dienoyl-CoA reductase/sulfur reductase-like enzyme
MKNGVSEILKDDTGNVSEVVLKDGTKISCEMVLIGAGINPATSFLSKTDNDIKLDKDGAIVCDPFMQSSNKDIFAAGDVATFPFWQTGKNTRVEHWITA